jgi:hypothetical protein
MIGEPADDGWGGLSTVEGPLENTQQLEDDPDEIIPEEELPFSKLKITPGENEEDELSKIRTCTPILFILQWPLTCTLCILQYKHG